MQNTPPDTRTMLAALGTALQNGQREEVARLIAALVASAAPLGPQWRSLAMASRADGALTQARAAMQLYVRQVGSTPLARFEEAAFLAEIGDVAEAAARLATIPATIPNAASHAHFAGTLALNTGELETARACFRRALAARPESGMTWLSLVDAERGQPADTWVQEVMDARPRLAAAAETERAPYLYALGSALDAAGRHDAAFKAFAEGATLVRSRVQYDARADAAAAEQAMSELPQAPNATDDTSRTIFVFGLPRSGTTLVEQILASHSAVADGGEAGLFDHVVRRIGGLSAAHLDRALATIGRDPLVGLYQNLVSERFGSAGRIVDKSLNMSRFAGLVAALLPDAPLIWVRRNALDGAWSCFRTWFTQGLTWSWDLADIARHFATEARLLAHWQRTLGDRLLVVDYEALVEQPEATISTVLAHCGLAPEAGVFTPHRTQRSVATASVSQVRQPINRSAVGAAEPYRRHLQPFIDTYQALGRRID